MPAAIRELCVNKSNMASRIRENGIKALIYLLLFAAMMFKTFFSERVEQSQGPKAEQVSIPVRMK